MRNFELEDGEAYFLQQQDDDDENIDPDKDFSYIDKKIENVLGHYQKDFMGGLSAESLGARYGGYGSFLPMQQRSPPILSNQRTQMHISSKSPQNLQSERFHQNATVGANHSQAAKPAPGSSDDNVQAPSESSSMNNQIKLQGSAECASDNLRKKPMQHHSEQKPLKVRLKFSCDNSALYSGLGLDISPSSSPEDSPSDYDGISPGVQEMKPESPSCIVKIMTTFPLPNNELVSPLHDSLVYLMETENILETALPGCVEALPVNGVHQNSLSNGKREASKDRKSKIKDSNKDRKSRQKDLNEESNSKKAVESVKPVELVKDGHDYIPTAASLSVNRREDSGSSAIEAIAFSKATDSVGDAQSQKTKPTSLTRNSTGSKPSMCDQKSVVGCSEEVINNSVQQTWIAGDKVKVESALLSSYDAAVEDGWDVNTSRGKTKKDGNADSVMRKETNAHKRNEVGRREEEANKLLKQQTLSKEQVKRGVLDSIHPKQDGGFRNENVVVETISKDKDVALVSMKGVEGDDKHSDIFEEMKCNNIEVLEPSKEKAHAEVMPHPPMAEGELRGKEHPSSMAKKKSKESQTDGIFSVESPRRSLVAGSLAVDNEIGVRHSISSKSKRGDINVKRESRKGNDVASDAHTSRKGKDSSVKDLMMGVSGTESRPITVKLKEKSSSKNNDVASHSESNMGNLATGNCVMEKQPVGDMLPAHNDAFLLHENWVECDKCNKWRLLPYGKDPDSLPKKWICSMLTWLPGMNRCSFSEEETTAAFHALYSGPGPTFQAQLTGKTYPDGHSSLGASSGVEHVGVPGRAPNPDAITSGGNRRNLVQTETDAARRSGSQEHIRVKKDRHHSSGSKSSTNEKKLSRESNAIRKSGDGKQSKIERKRAADLEASGLPKKIQRVHQQSMENPDSVGRVKGEAKGENQSNGPTASRTTKDLAKGSSASPLMKTIGRTQNVMIAKDSKITDVLGKKRKLKDHLENVVSTEEHSGKVQQQSGKNSGTERREEKKEKKSKAANLQGRDFSRDKGYGKTDADGTNNHNLGSAGDNTRHKRGRTDNWHVREHHAGRASPKTVRVRKSSEKAPDLGLSDNATTSSSSKISLKGKAKASEVKCSPIGSISSSPFRVSKFDPDRVADPDELLSARRLISRAEAANNVFVPHSQETKDKRSNLSKNSHSVFDVAVGDQSGGKTSAGRHPGPRTVDSQTKVLEKDACGKSDRTYREGGALSSQQNLVSGSQLAKSLNRLDFDEKISERGKLHVALIDSHKEPACHSFGAPTLDKGNGSSHVSLGHPQTSRHVSKEIEASSSMKNDNFHRAAKTALKEAKSLKNSASRLKKSGSEIESSQSTEVFFQAALKFLHGASLLEPSNSESGRCGEMTSTEVYSTTAKLCEYCAHEYERCNDMASAALAYKCMEVAYMRVVYFNDFAASKDRLELQKAVRAAPQVESPSSSASDIDNLNNQAAADTVKDGHSAMDHRSHVISAGNTPNFMRLLNFTQDINLAMEASRSSQIAFAAANPILTQAGNEEGICFIKRVLDFSFHDVDGLLDLVRLAMEALNTQSSASHNDV